MSSQQQLELVRKCLVYGAVVQETGMDQLETIWRHRARFGSQGATTLHDIQTYGPIVFLFGYCILHTWLQQQQQVDLVGVD